MDASQFKLLLKRAKMSVCALATMVPVTETTLYAYARGYRSIPLSFKSKLASALRKHAAVLIDIAKELDGDER